MISLSPAALRLLPVAGLACLLLSPLVGHADEPIVKWPLPTAPSGTNTAAYPAPRVEWLERFQHNLERTKKGNADLIFDGDSITDGWQTRGKEVFAKNFGSLHPADFGISGDRTEHVLWRLDHGQVAGLHPKMVALMIGTNNLAANTPEQIAEGVTAIVHEYQKLCPEAVILLQAVFPRAASATDPLRTKIKGINEIIAKLGDGKKVIYIDFGDKFLQPDGALSRDIMPDFLHPNAQGYEIWADAIRPEVEKVLGSATKTAP